jgi:predicted extracellular nuclease
LDCESTHLFDSFKKPIKKHAIFVRFKNHPDMKKHLNFYFLLLLSLTACNLSIFGQHDFYQPQNFFTIVSYNIENLFDTIDDPNKKDEDFLPDAAAKWNIEKYNKKIKDIALVISSINKHELPELVGLVEIENAHVLKDLIQNINLKAGNYAFVHHDSPDERGIDVALLYRPDEFQYMVHEIIPVNFDFDPAIKTRDILYVAGKIGAGEILHVFVNHWNSRREGLEITEPRRTTAAKLLRLKIDQILLKDKNAKIVVMGDFNDEPSNKSLREVLFATNKLHSKDYRELYNLMFDKHLLGQGTYTYRGNWNMLDNIIVSRALLHSPGKYQVSKDGGQIFQQRWMMFDNVKTGEMTPNRTYGGPNYYGGASDHLPVYLILKK